MKSFDPPDETATQALVVRAIAENEDVEGTEAGIVALMDPDGISHFVAAIAYDFSPAERSAIAGGASLLVVLPLQGPDPAGVNAPWVIVDA